MKDKLLLQDLVVLLAIKAGITQKDADLFYRELIRLILDRIYDNDIVKIKGLGTFKSVLISSRDSVDVNTGKKIEIPAHLRLSFMPDNSLKELLNKPFAQFESVLLDDDDLTLPSNILNEEDDDDDLLEEDNKSELDISDLFSDDIVLSTPNTTSRFINKSKTSDIPRYFRNSSVLGSDLLNQTKETEKLSLKDDLDSKKNVTNKGFSVQEDNRNRNDLNKDQENRISNQFTESTGIDGAENNFFNKNDLTSIKKTKKENLVDFDDSDVEYHQPNYQQQDILVKKRKKIVIIIVSIVVGLFAIYQYAKLFDVTYDYEYYINRAPNLTLSDTLPYLDDLSDLNKSIDTTKVSLDEGIKSDSIVSSSVENVQVKSSAKDSVDRLLTQVSPYPDYFTDGVLEKEASDLDSLFIQLDSNNKYSKKEYLISDGLQIKVGNKADLFLKSKAR